MRVDVAFILERMFDATLGRTYKSLVDFRAVQNTPTNVNVTWLNQTVPMPSEAAIDAAAPNVVSQQGTRDAQAAKAAASAGIDRGELKEGLAIDRATVAVVFAALAEFNAHALKINAILDAVDAATSLADLKTRIALIADYPQRTKTQLKNLVKSEIANTAE